MIYHVGEGIETFLHRKGILVVNGTKIFGDFTGGYEIRRARKTDRKGVKAWPGARGI